MRRRAVLALLLAGMAAPSAVQACTFRWARGWSPEEIKRRADVRKVRGVWRRTSLEGRPFTDEEGQEWITNARFLGRIETRRGTGWDTEHPAPDHSTTCFVGAYFKPEFDAAGTFWISRRASGGRYRILLWEGEYVPPAAQAAAE